MSAKGKIRRDKPNKKWSEREVQQILDYLIEENEYEQPTAQIFYREFVESSNINATWDLVRWKVRHLKETYKKAESWRKSIDAGLLESASGPLMVQAKILKICPHYDKLRKIFGSQLDESISFEAVDVERSSDISSFQNATKEEYIEDFELDEDSTNHPSSDIEEESNALLTPVSSTSRREPKSNTAASGYKRNQTFSHSQQTLLQRAQSELDKSRLEFERWKLEQEFMIRKEELAIKREELSLRRLEIEKGERVAMHEIDMKYKNNHTN